MEEFAAGIIPYHYYENEYHFLLGFEKNKWSGFVGGSERYESIIQTAVREFNEETSLLFNNNLEYFYNSCVNTQPIIEKTPTGKIAYLFFINCNKGIFNKPLEQFYINQTMISDQHFKEKSQLKWFSLSQIKTATVLSRLKKTILNHF